MKKLCIYHGFCDDGFAAALVVYLAMARDVELFAASYGKPAPDVTGRDVIIVDFSYPHAVMEELANKAASILMLDHHKSAAEDMAGFERPNCTIIFDMDRSGAMMAWDHFGPWMHFGLEFIRLIQDRDLWQKQMRGTEEFTMALRSYPQDLAIWEGFLKSGPEELIEEGVAILRYYRQLVEAAKTIAYEAELDGVVVPVCNSTFALASDVAGELSEGRPFAAVFYETDEGYVYSLRSRKGGMDVSAIAKKFGGGGHAQASGFRSAAPVHVKVPRP